MKQKLNIVVMWLEKPMTYVNFMLQWRLKFWVTFSQAARCQTYIENDAINDHIYVVYPNQ